jgi:hypothetical protein
VRVQNTAQEKGLRKLVLVMESLVVEPIRAAGLVPSRARVRSTVNVVTAGSVPVSQAPTTRDHITMN